MPSIIANVIGRKKFISSEDDAQFLLLSDTGGASAGMWVLQFVSDPDDPFVGSLSIQGRIQGQQAFTDEVPFAPVPYRAAILNGVLSDYSLQSAAIDSHSLFYVPATGAAIALLASVTSGHGVLYSYPREGDAGLP